MAVHVDKHLAGERLLSRTDRSVWAAPGRIGWRRDRLRHRGRRRPSRERLGQQALQVAAGYRMPVVLGDVGVLELGDRCCRVAHRQPCAEHQPVGAELTADELDAAKQPEAAQLDV